MGLGKRQALAAQVVAAAPYTFEFTVDQGVRLIKRIKLLNGTDKIPAIADTVRIEAEGEVLYSGLALPIVALFLKTDHSAANGEVHLSPHVLEFDNPLKLDEGFPIRITINNADDDLYYCIIEGLD